MHLNNLLILNSFNISNLNSFNILGIYQDCLNYNLPFNIVTIVKINSNKKVQNLIYSINKLIAPNIKQIYKINSNYIIPSKLIEDEYGKYITWADVNNINNTNDIKNINNLINIIKAHNKILINTFGNLDYLANLQINYELIAEKIYNSQHNIPILNGIYGEKQKINNKYYNESNTKGMETIIEIAKIIRQIRIKKQIKKKINNINNIDGFILPLLYASLNLVENNKSEDYFNNLNISNKGNLLINNLNKLKTDINRKYDILLKGWLDFEEYSSNKQFKVENRKLFISTINPLDHVLVLIENRDKLTQEELCNEKINLKNTVYIGNILNLIKI